MNFKEIASRYGAFVAAAIIFVAMSLIYCSPVLKGKVITTGDSTNADAAVHEAITYTEQTGDHSWWTGSMFSGMPNYQIGGGEYKSGKFLAPFGNILHRGHWRTEWVFIIYFFCFFILLLSFGVDRWASIAGAIAIALSSYFIVIIAAGHNGKTSTIALMSVVLGGFHLIFRKKYGMGVFLAMFFTAMGYSTHPQMSYYIFMLIGLLWIGELWQHIKEKRFKDLVIGSLLFFGAVGIGVGTSMANVFANKEYVGETMRGGHSDLVKEGDGEASSSKGLDIAYATQWSYGIDETMSFMIPGFMGGASAAPVSTDSRLYKGLVKNGVPAKSAKDFCANAPLYWGDQPFTAGNVYMGAVICFLFLLGLLIVEGPYKWMLLLATIFSTMLAWGSNCMWLTELFFKYFPLYSKFRAVSSILIVAEITMPLLGFLAIKAIMDGDVSREKAVRSTLISGGITAGICLFFAAFGGMIFDFTSPNDAGFAGSLPDWLYKLIVDERASLLAKDSLRSALFIAASAFTVWLWAKGKIKNGIMIAALGVLIVIDMWPVDRRYFNDRNFVTPKQGQATFQMQPYEAAILKDPDPHFRVMNLTVSTFNDARTSYYLKSIGGYCAAKLRRYQDLIDVHLSKVNLPVIGMLNGKYIITQGQDGQPVPMVNPDALGNAWYVSSIKVVDTPDEEINGLMSVDLHNTALTDKNFASYVVNPAPAVPEDARVWLTRYTPKSLDYKCESSEDGTIVFSEIYYPYGWKATIDGTPADHFRANYILRAMNVPAGSHDIHFEFDPDSVRKGDTISLIFIALMYIITATIAALGIWRKVKSSR
ncbi:MAG: hypothetical protein MJZ04_02125 [Bacteroidales bacterium]|nr:hypothetical protein [Bacteroidales bacterium]